MASRMKQLSKLPVLALLFLSLSAVAQPIDQSEPDLPLKSAGGGTDFAQAQPEDITNENFPQMIESFDYPNANIEEVVKAISKLTGKNFILEKGISGTISIIAPSPVTVAEAYKAFLTALALNNLTVVPSGKFLKIRRIQDATSDSIDTYAGAYFPTADQLITRIVKLQYVNAEELQKTLRPLSNKQGDITVYPLTNSLIITDLGSNVERLVNIIDQLDVPGFEEKLVVVPIKFARAKEIADLIDQIINKGDKKQQFQPGIPRFRSNLQQQSGAGSGAANYSLVIPDSRTNSIIVVGNQAGIQRIRELVSKLDFKLRAEDEGGVYVYYIRHGEAEKVANILNGVATESTKTNQQQAQAGSNPNAPVASPGQPPAQAVFGGDVKVAADKENNSLIITASRQDYEVVLSILRKIDIPRDQVFVKAIIMEMSSNDTVTWGIDYYKFAEDTGGVGRAGFRSSGIGKLTNPAEDSGLVFGFGSGDLVEITVGSAKAEVPSLVALINFLKSQTNANVLSTPQVTAMDNEEAEIVVAENVPVGTKVESTAVGSTAAPERRDLELKLLLTPYISPDTDSVRMKIEQTVQKLGGELTYNEAGATAPVFTTRSVKTNVIVNSNETAVIGGLLQDDESDRVTKVPVLGDIPILGWLFKGKSVTKIKKNLLVFITPKIIRNTQDTSDLLNEKLNERVDFIQQTMKGRDVHGYEIDQIPRKQVSEGETQEFIEEIE